MNIGRNILSLLVCCALSVASMFAQEQKGQFTVVIDAGHGGKDPGAMANGYKEKDIALAVALRAGKSIKANHPAVRVLYTRDKDVFVGLQARSDFANRHKASLFISVHLNSSTGNSAYGTETYVLGLSKQSNNLSVAMRENKVMLLEQDYKTTYKGFDPTNAESYIIFDLMQEDYINRSIDMANYVERQYKRNGRSSRGVRQEGLWVLSQSAMPSILTEIGFISNPKEAQYLGSERGQEEVATAISQAFTRFYEAHGSVGRERSGIDTNNQTATAELYDTPRKIKEQSNSSSNKSDKSSPNSRSTKSEPYIYRIQFMTDKKKLDTKDSQFKRIKQPIYREQSGKVWVYLAGKANSLDEARKLHRSISKLYPDCYIVRYNKSTGSRLGRI